jgi:uncharacterized protein (TIGR02996 family)
MPAHLADWPDFPPPGAADADEMRLRWADYLDDRGQHDWAELIRLQLTLAHFPVEQSPPPEWLEREAELNLRLGQQWLEALADLLTAPPQFRYGLPDAVAVDARVFLRRGSELLSRLPIRRLRLIEPVPVWKQLWNCPWLKGIEELDLCGAELTHCDLTPLFRSPYLQSLQLLDLSFNQLEDTALLPWRRGWTFPHLRCLALNDNRLTDRAVALLVDCPDLHHLEELDLSRNEITAAGVKELVAHSGWQLHRVELSGNPLGDHGLALLAQSSLLLRMSQRHGCLELQGHAQLPISPAGIEALVHSEATAHLRVLDLGHQGLGDDGCVTLLGSCRWPHLRRLSLPRNRITDQAIIRLRPLWPQWLAQLSSLDLAHNRLTSFGVGLLSAALPPDKLGAALDTTGNLHHSIPSHAESDPPDPRFRHGREQDLHLLRQRIAHPRRLRS